MSGEHHYYIHQHYNHNYYRNLGNDEAGENIH